MSTVNKNVPTVTTCRSVFVPSAVSCLRFGYASFYGIKVTFEHCRSGISSLYLSTGFSLKKGALCLFCELQSRRRKTVLLHQWSLIRPCCDYLCFLPNWCIFRPAVWLVSVPSVKPQTHSDSVWLAIRTHCGSLGGLSYYCDNRCGAIFKTELAWPFFFLWRQNLGLSSPSGPDDSATVQGFFVSFSIRFSLTGFINSD